MLYQSVYYYNSGFSFNMKIFRPQAAKDLQPLQAEQDPTFPRSNSAARLEQVDRSGQGRWTSLDILQESDSTDDWGNSWRMGHVPDWSYWEEVSVETRNPTALWEDRWSFPTLGGFWFQPLWLQGTGETWPHTENDQPCNKRTCPGGRRGPKHSLLGGAWWPRPLRPAWWQVPLSSGWLDLTNVASKPITFRLVESPSPAERSVWATRCLAKRRPRKRWTRRNSSKPRSLSNFYFSYQFHPNRRSCEDDHCDRGELLVV